MHSAGSKESKSPKAKRITSRRASISKSTRRSQQQPPSPKSSSNKPSSVPSNRRSKLGTPRAIPKLLMANLFSPRSPHKNKPSTSRSRRKHHAQSSLPNSLLNTAIIPRNSSRKQLEAPVPTTELLQTNKKATNSSQEASKVWEALKLPTTAITVLQLLESSLTKYEQSEILSYHEIFTIGIAAKKPKSKIDAKCNYGYDDDRNDYNVVTGDHIAYRYEIVKVLGSGSFGQVLLAVDHKTGKECAVKVIRNKTRFHQQALIEVEILKLVTEKDCHNAYNVVHIIDNLMFRKHMCIIFELLSINLYELLKSNEFNGLSNNLIRRFAVQIAQSLKLMARYQIIHCDLKPENILLKQPNRSSIKVIDFGSSCFHSKRVYTYIQSRFYRAPEIILGVGYTTAIDMWSLGCILAELHTGYPLFPGESEAEQILCMMEVLGMPSKSLMKQATRASKFFEQDGSPKLIVNSRGKKRIPNTKRIEQILKGAEPGLVDVVKKCLEWDPNSRISAEEVLGHEWMKENRLSLTKNFSRGGSAQPHQGTIPKHSHKFSLEEPQLSLRSSFLLASCKNQKNPTFVF